MNDPTKARELMRETRVREFTERYIGRSDLGVEIGPFDRPMLERPEWNVLYADVDSTEELRARARRNPRRHVDRVVDVDILIGERSLADSIDGRSARFIFGLHVFEHIPNLIGFLRDIAAALGKGGHIIGAFPDRRYTFDIDRPRTTIGQLVEWDRRNLIRPSVTSVMDHYTHFRALKAGQIWNHGNDHGVERSYTLDFARQKAEQAETTYLDVHCNVFADSEFAEIIDQISKLGVPVELADMVPTERPLNEFLFSLTVTR